MKKDWMAFQSEQSASENSISESSVKAPAHLSASIRSTVKAELKPSAARVLAKLGIIHVATSVITLSVCPQFGFRLFGDGMGLMESFMKLGDFGCAVACGTLFVGSSFTLAALLFTRPEWRAIRDHRILTLTAILLPSFGFFKVMDGEFFFAFSAAWLLGALLTGFLLMEGVWRIKFSPSRFLPQSG